MVIKFLYSKSNIPYIDMGDFGKLTFSKTTAHKDKGYKWLAYYRAYIDAVVIKKTSKGEIIKDVYEVPDYDAYVFTFKMKRDYKGEYGIPRGTIPPRLVKFFIKTFEPLLAEDDYFPYENVKLLEDIIENTDFDKVLSEPIKRKKRNG